MAHKVYFPIFRPKGIKVREKGNLYAGVNVKLDWYTPHFLYRGDVKPLQDVNSCVVRRDKRERVNTNTLH